MRIVTDFPNPGVSDAGWTQLTDRWSEEARIRYRATDVFNGAAPLDGEDWAVVCTPPRVRYWIGLAPIVYVTPDDYELLEPLVHPEVWALRIASGETASACGKVLEKYGSLRAVPPKAKKWAPLAKDAALLLWQTFPQPEKLAHYTERSYVKLGPPPGDYTLCIDYESLSQRLLQCANAGRWSYDFEFGGDDSEDEEEKDASLLPVGVSLSWAPGEACYVPLGHEGFDRNLPAGYVLPRLDIPGATLWNAKADLQVHMAWAEREREGGLDTEALFHFRSPPDDAMALSYMLSLTPLSLKKRTWLDFGFRMQPIAELIGKRPKQIPFSKVPVEKAVRYGCQDSDWTLRHWNAKWPLLYDRGKTLYQEIERPLTVILAHAQLNGMPFDREKLTDMWTEDIIEMANLERMIFALVGVEWNMNSSEQTACVLYKKLGLPPQKPTGTFKPSVGADALYPIATMHPIVPLYLRWSKLNKLKAAFYQKLLSLPGRSVHARMNQFIVDTGRLSSADPNMQQNPDKVREAFTGAPALMAADESQLELRIMARVSQDPGMLAAYMSDPPVDLHDDTMARTGLEERRPAKIVNFLTQYGGAAPNLQLALAKQGIYWTLGRCQDLLDIFFEIRPRLRPHMKEVIDFALEHGYSETLDGRRRYVPEITSTKPDQRSHAERQLCNHEVQGTGADIVKRAMVTSWRDIVTAGCWLGLQVHDELVVLGPRENLEELVPVVRRALTEPNPIAPVPLLADIHIASNWKDAH